MYCNKSTKTKYYLLRLWWLFKLMGINFNTSIQMLFCKIFYPILSMTPKSWFWMKHKSHSWLNKIVVLLYWCLSFWLTSLCIIHIYMEFKKIVMITLYARQQKRHRCIEQSFRLCRRGRGWDDLGEWHWNMYNIIYETNRQSRFNAWHRSLGAGALGRPRGMGWGGRREGDSGWGARVHLWQIPVDIWQNQYNIVK